MCPVCGVREGGVGVLCAECCNELSRPNRITPEQVESTGGDPDGAVLIDMWGRPHRLSSPARIGRHIDGAGIAIVEPSVSRSHGELARGDTGWWLRDFGSVNGSYVQDQLVEGVLPVPDRATVRFGELAFYFVERGAELPAVGRPRIATTTIPRIVPGAPPPALVTPRSDDFRDEPTDPGLPSLVVRLHQPTGGGGGLIQIEGAQLQVTTPQFELMELMVRRMQRESHRPPLVRGFVRSVELIEQLSWDTTEPNDSHVKQLVRRMRRTLIRSGVGDLIESRHRYGYRLRATPRTD